MIAGKVQRGRSRRVHVHLRPKLLNKEFAGPPVKYAAKNSNDVQPAFVLAMAKATDLDLWLDGHRLKGLVADAARRPSAQDKLEKQVS